MMIIFGLNSVVEALRSGSGVTRILIRQGKGGGRLQQMIDLAREEGVPVRFEKAATLDRKAAGERHQGVIAEMSQIRYRELPELLSTAPKLLLLADGVEDPHNLGAVLRTAAAAGVGGVLLPERHSCGVTPAVVKASAGTALGVPVVRIGNVSRTLQGLKAEGFWSVGLDMEGDIPPHEVPTDLPLVVVVGGEHRGLRPLVKRHCDFLVSLPMSGRVSSLNLSVAAGILLYQIVISRQQSAPSDSRSPESADSP